MADTFQCNARNTAVTSFYPHSCLCMKCLYISINSGFYDFMLEIKKVKNDNLSERTVKFEELAQLSCTTDAQIPL